MSEGSITMSGLDSAPVRIISRKAKVKVVAEQKGERTEPAGSVDLTNLLAQIEALEAKLAEANAKMLNQQTLISSQKNQIQRLQNQLETCVDLEDDCPDGSNVRKPPRKVVRKSAQDNSSTSAAGGDMAVDEEFPALPLVRSANTNQFAPLAAVDVNSNNNKATKTSDKRSIKIANEIAQTNNGKHGRKKIIQAIHTNIYAVRRQLAAANIKSFSVKQTKRTGPIAIVISDEAEVGSAKSALVEDQTSFHEFKWPDEKQKCFIIHGLVGASAKDLPEIKQELCAAGLPENIVVSLHKTGYMRANQSESHDAPVKLLLPAGAHTGVLQGIRFLNHIGVRFELFKSKSIVQCKICQRFGHSAGGCQHPHRCVKCGQNHLREDCPRTHDASVKLCCCNCGSEHTANNLNACSSFKQHYAKSQTEPKITTVTSARPAVPPAPRLPGVSFAQVVGRPSTRNMPAVTRPIS